MCFFIAYNMSISSHYNPERGIPMESEQADSRAAIITVALGTFMTCFDSNTINIIIEGVAEE
jgi:hypothetical protein